MQYEDVQVMYNSYDQTIKVVHGWYVPSEYKQSGIKNHGVPDWTILHVHGHTGNIGDRLSFLRFVRQYLPWCSVLLFDYRGFGMLGSSDSPPSVKDCHESTWQAFKWLLMEKSVPVDKLMIWGETTGCFFASHLLAQNVGRSVGALVLQCPFPSMRHWVHSMWGKYLLDIQDLVIPQEYVMKDIVKQVTEKGTPVISLHVDCDKSVPIEKMENLIDSVTSFVVVRGAVPDDILRDGYKEVLRSLQVVMPNILEVTA
jgi:pimeloyl-ACP methyl ester carboxylesterase